MKRSINILLAGAAVAVCVSGAAAAPPRIFSRIGGNVQVAVVINNLRKFSNGVSTTAQALQLPLPGDVLSLAENSMQLTQGLDEKGSAAIVVPTLGAGFKPSAMSRNVIILLPATSVKQLLAPWHPKGPGHGIMTVTNPSGSGQIFYAAKSGHFAVLAESHAALRAFLHRRGTLLQQLSPQMRQFIAHKDAEVYVNLPKVVPSFTHLVSNAARSTGLLPPATRIMLNMEFAALDTVAGKTKSAMLGVRLGRSGITFGDAVQTRPGAGLAGILQNGKPLGKHTFAGLVAKHALVTLAASVNGKAVAALERGIYKHYKSQHPKEESSAASQMAKQVEKAAPLWRGTRFQMLRQTNGQGGFIRGIIITRSPNAKALLKQKIDAIHNQLWKGLIGNMPGVPQPRVVIQPGSKAISGVKFKRVTVTFRTPSGNPSAAAMRRELQAMYGKNITSYLGTYKNYYLETIGVGPATLRKTVANLKQGKDPLAGSEAVRKLARHVLPQPRMVAYVRAAALMQQMGRMLAATRGAAAPAAQAGAGALPAVASATAQGHVVQAQVYMPYPQLLAAARAAQQLQAAAMQGNAGQ